MGERYHYESSGLPDIWLRNGFEVLETAYGEAVSIHNVEGLHKAIGSRIVRNAPVLSNDEIRFLRKELDLSQKDLADLLSVSESSLRNWENKDRADMPGPADRMLRVLYLEYICGNTQISHFLERISQINRDMYIVSMEFQETDGDWQAAA